MDPGAGHPHPGPLPERERGKCEPVVSLFPRGRGGSDGPTHLAAATREPRTQRRPSPAQRGLGGGVYPEQPVPLSSFDLLDFIVDDVQDPAERGSTLNREDGYACLQHVTGL